jgi:hypothetical protein
MRKYPSKQIAAFRGKQPVLDNNLLLQVRDFYFVGCSVSYMRENDVKYKTEYTYLKSSVEL